VGRSLADLVDLITSWGYARGILQHSNPQAQLLKSMSELGELADAVLKKDRPKIEDGIGDTVVTLILCSELCGLSFRECVDSAYQTIKDRKGTLTSEGVFVKEEPGEPKTDVLP
jgi:NTP pyrophosphatase (non-canonical NTP hydrolase)